MDLSRRKLLGALGGLGLGGYLVGQSTALDDPLWDRLHCGRRIQPDWKYHGGSNMGPPTVVEDSVLVSPYYGLTPGMGGPLLRLDRTDKSEIWQFGEEGNFGLPRVTEDSVYVGTSDDKVFALDPETATEQWQFDAGGIEEYGGGIWNRPAVVAGNVVVEFTFWPGPEPVPEDFSEYEKRVLALDADTGERQWTIEPDRSPEIGPIPVGSDVVVGWGQTLRRLAGTDGTERWSVTLDEPTDVHWRWEKVDDSAVVCSGSTVYSVELDSGTIRWTRTLGDGWTPPGRVADYHTYVSAGIGAGTDAILVGTVDGDVHALDAADGHTRWSTSISSDQEVAALAVDPTGSSVFATSHVGRMHELDLTDGEATGSALFVEQKTGSECGIGYTYHPTSMVATDEALYVTTEEQLRRVDRSAI